MEQQILKVSFKNYLLELVFHTDYCLSIKAKDVFDNHVYENKNVEFEKIQRSAVLAAFKQNSKEITCTLSQKFIEEQMNRSLQDIKVQQKKCMEIKFNVNSDFIIPFSQTIVLYRVESEKKSQKILPQQIGSKTATEIRKSIDLIEKSISIKNQEEDKLKIFEIGVLSTIQKANEQFYIFVGAIAYAVGLIILWSTCLQFLQILVLIIIGGFMGFYYFLTQTYLLTKIKLKQGLYKIDVSGMFSVPTNYTNTTISFYLNAKFNRWSQKQLKIYLFSNYSYAAPFNGTFLIESKRQQELTLELQKNQISLITVTNVLTTCEKIPFFMKTK